MNTSHDFREVQGLRRRLTLAIAKVKRSGRSHKPRNLAKSVTVE
jgi:hypothetical protein